MNSIDEKIANEIWPQYARPSPERIPYQDKVDQAKRYLGDNYLLARPINRPRG